jgi:uncharacterized membrane protein YoaK (UPF0700 family)
MSTSPTSPVPKAIPQLLMILTVVTGLVDAVSYLKLDHVFVANMTGNVVFLGFSLAGAPGFSMAGSIIAVVAFLAGAVLGGRIFRKVTRGHAHLLIATTLAKVILILVAAALFTFMADNEAARLWVTGALAVSMGLQNAVARSIGLPDMTTTVLTLTLTGIGADSSLAGGDNPRLARRIASVVLMFAGALIGTFLALDCGAAYPLLLVVVLLLIAAAISYRAAFNAS